jgi:general secretion pathway protein L
VNVDVRRSLHPLRVRYASPAIARGREFWEWWSGEIFAILPENLRDAIAQRRQKLFLETDGRSLQLSLGSWGSRQDVGQAPLTAPAEVQEKLPRDAQQTILLMPDGKVLTRSLALPLAAEENLREVLGFEMDQHTPFQAAKVYYDFVVTGRDTERQELLVDLVYSPRSEVDALLEAIAGHDLDVDVVTSRGRDGSNLRSINLLPEELRHRRRVSPRRLNVALAALCAALLVVALALPILQKNEALVLLEEQVQAAAAEAREGNQVRRDLEKMADASRFLFEKKRSEIMTVTLIDEISRILPDHTWVIRLDLSETEMQVQGQSQASASLIALIEASPLFENASFRSPVVQVTGTDADRFHLSADIVRSEEP